MWMARHGWKLTLLSQSDGSALEIKTSTPMDGQA